MSPQTRRRLPARVYWVRRLMLLGIAGLLVVGIAQLLGGNGGGTGGTAGGDTAAKVADLSSAPTTAGSPTTGLTRAQRRLQRTQPSDTPVTRVAMPSGPCTPSDVAITPSVPKPVAGGDISLVLDISSVTTPACTWSMSGSSLAMRITSGQDLIWTTTECAKAIPAQDLVLRQSSPTRVRVTWDARRSEPGCPVQTAWALPGTYHLSVAALAGSPQEVTFQLTAPSPAQITRTAHPQTGTHHKKHRPAG